MTQFGFYVNKYAEELRDRFVDFEGKKQLTIDFEGDFQMDRLAVAMVQQEVVKNIKDPSVVDWMLPAFTTTEAVDQFVASMSIMATLQKYFEYGFC
jgi:hypothetical protein